MSRRPLAVFAVFLCLGIITARLSDSYFMTSLLVAFMILVCTIIIIKHPGFRFVLLGAILFFSIGGYELLMVNHSQMNKFKAYAGKDVTIKGFINSIPDVKESSVSYVIKTQSLEVDGKEDRIQGKILSTVMKKENEEFFDYGRGVLLKGELTLPKGRRNPGGFDYRSYLAANGISATIFSTSQNIVLQNEYGANFLERTGLGLRQRIIRVINGSLPLQQAGLFSH